MGMISQCISSQHEAQTICNINPMPRPAMIWYPIHVARLESMVNVVYKPAPTEVKVVPTSKNGL